MKLNSIQLSNYCCHTDLKVDFEPGFNVIVGINGGGKTSLLKGICESFFGLTHVLHGVQNNPLIAQGNTRIAVTTVDGRYRYEPQYPVKVFADGYAFGSTCNWTLTSTGEVGHPQLTGMSAGHVWFQLQHQSHDSALVSSALPLVAFYRTNRYWNLTQSNQMQAVTKRNSRIDGYSNWWDASLDSSSLQEWVISKYLERFQTSSENGISIDDIVDDELASVNLALRAVVEGASGLRYDLKQKSLLMEWMPGTQTSTPTEFAKLSDGQRAIICLVTDMTRRMCLINPQFGVEVTLKTQGIVLIDELDLHLHPKWQRLITKGLQAAFPAIQFIVASHSPQVLSELQPEQIILLRPEGTSHPQVSYGMDSSKVLDEIMGASPRPVLVEEELNNLFETLERNDLESARNLLNLLKIKAPGIAELGGAEALIKRKEVLGR